MNQKESEELSKAISIAMEFHKGQKREDNSPYILHPMRVMLQMDTATEMIVAILHDILEDTTCTLAYLIQKNVCVRSGLMLEALKVLTKKENQSYSEYIENICPNHLARKVKRADIRDNLNVLELCKIDDYRLKRIKKYYEAYQRLNY